MGKTKKRNSRRAPRPRKKALKNQIKKGKVGRHTFCIKSDEELLELASQSLNKFLEDFKQQAVANLERTNRELGGHDLDEDDSDGDEDYLVEDDSDEDDSDEDYSDKDYSEEDNSDKDYSEEDNSDDDKELALGRSLYEYYGGDAEDERAFEMITNQLTFQNPEMKVAMESLLRQLRVRNADYLEGVEELAAGNAFEPRQNLYVDFQPGQNFYEYVRRKAFNPADEYFQYRRNLYEYFRRNAFKPGPNSYENMQPGDGPAS